MTESKVVPFDRDASFLRARAQKLKRAGRLTDALELMRRAAGIAPEEDGCWLDMADVYEEMSCPFDSRRMALMELFHHPENPECFYRLAQYDGETGNLDEARRAYEHYLTLCPEGEQADEARMELESIEAAGMLWKQMDRQSRRRMQRLRRVRSCQMEQDYEGADRILAREQASLPGDPQMNVSRAMNLYMMGDGQGARDQLDQVRIAPDSLPGVVIMAAQVYYRLGEKGRAVRLLNDLDMQSVSPSELRMLMGLLTDMEQSEQAMRAGRELLQQAPYDRMTLHLMAVNAMRLEKTADAAGYWQRLSRMNPEDDVARWYGNELRAGRLRPEDVNDSYQLPRDEVIRRSRTLLWLLEMEPDQAQRAWREDDDVRSTLHWALMSEVPQLVEPSLKLLALFGDEKARQLQVDFVSCTHLGFEYDFATAGVIGAQQHWACDGMREYMKLRYFTPDFQELLQRLDVGRRQMIRMADAVLQEEYGLKAAVALAAEWLRMEQCGGREVVRDLRCGAAALALNALTGQHMEVSARQIARQFRCSVRKLQYYASWMKDAEGKHEAFGLH